MKALVEKSLERFLTFCTRPREARRREISTLENCEMWRCCAKRMKALVEKSLERFLTFCTRPRTALLFLTKKNVLHLQKMKNIRKKITQIQCFYMSSRRKVFLSMSLLNA